ncbi:MAG TPA: phosphoglycerate dehydrogenase [Pirellulales bacterium]|nr:phosphoglycerate dehydrogenase [Pirellulales bacterium]
MPRILVTPSVIKHQPGPYREVLEQAGFEVVYPTAQLSESVADPPLLLSQLEGVSGVLAGSELYNREVLSRTKIRAIARMGVGYDAIDVPAASEHGILITTAPGTNQHSVAEQTISLLLGVFRGFPGRDQEVRSGVWKRQALPRLAGRTIGLAGLGRIGQAVVPRAIGLGLKVIAYDPFPNESFAAQHGVKLCGLDELLAEADIVSLHMPCTPETADLINAETLARMKPGSVLINTARGGLVDESALADALARGHLMAAGLDVFKIEPLPVDSPLLKLNNVLLSPHMGGLDLESQRDMSTLAAQCLVDLHQGRWPEGCVVNAELRPGWKW